MPPTTVGHGCTMDADSGVTDHRARSGRGRKLAATGRRGTIAARAFRTSEVGVLTRRLASGATAAHDARESGPLVDPPGLRRPSPMFQRCRFGASEHEPCAGLDVAGCFDPDSQSRTWASADASIAAAMAAANMSRTNRDRVMAGCHTI